VISLGDTREARAPTPDTTTRERERARREPARAMAATSCTVLAGSYERFVFGYALDVGSSDADGTTGGGGARLAKSFTVDAHLSSVKAVACAGGYAASGGSDDLIRVYHCDDRGAMADLGMCVGHRRRRARADVLLAERVRAHAVVVGRCGLGIDGVGCDG
jgi:hypothetical protein